MHEIRIIKAGEYSKLVGTCSELVGTSFTIKKMKFQWKFWGGKVQNWNNCRILRNSDQVSQPRNWIHL